MKYGTVFSVRLDDDMALKVSDALEDTGLTKTDLFHEMINFFIEERKEVPLFMADLEDF